MFERSLCFSGFDNFCDLDLLHFATMSLKGVHVYDTESWPAFYFVGSWWMHLWFSANLESCRLSQSKTKSEAAYNRNKFCLCQACFFLCLSLRSVWSSLLFASFAQLCVESVWNKYEISTLPIRGIAAWRRHPNQNLLKRSRNTKKAKPPMLFRGRSVCGSLMCEQTYPWKSQRVFSPFTVFLCHWPPVEISRKFTCLGLEMRLLKWSHTTLMHSWKSWYHHWPSSPTLSEPGKQ